MTDFDVQSFNQRFMIGLQFFESIDDEMTEFLEIVEHAHSYGVIIEPTMYRDMLYRKGNMDDLADAVRLAKPLVAKYREFQQIIESKT